MSKSRYEIIKPIGKGGMAEVFLAKDLLFDTNVALKVLLKEYQFNQQIKDRFLDEAKTLFRLSHPNIIKATALVDEPDMVSYSMDYVDGVDLRSWIQNPNRSPQLDLIEHVFKPALDAVACAHDNGIIHRDLKPSNFMVSKNGNLKLMDFGIAKHNAHQDSSVTVTGLMMGTPKYMSPEQVRSSKHVTVHSDIYSLGVILWELLAGRALYSEEALSAFDIQVKIVNESLPPVDPKWDSIIAKATQKKSEERFRSIDAFKAAILEMEPQAFQPSVQGEDETVLVDPSSSPAEDSTVVENSVEDTKIDSPLPQNILTPPSSESDNAEVFCPRCTGKGMVDASDIKKWSNEQYWYPGHCAYCDASGKVTRHFAKNHYPGDRRIFMGWRDHCLDPDTLEDWVGEASHIINVHFCPEDSQFTDSFNMPVDWILDWHEGVVQLSNPWVNQGIGLIGMVFPDSPDVPEAQYFFLLRSEAEDRPAVISCNRFNLLNAPLKNGFPDFETEVFWTSGECLLGHSMHKVWQEKSRLHFEYFDSHGVKQAYKFDFPTQREAHASALFWGKIIDSPLGFMAVYDQEEYDAMHDDDLADL